MDESSPHATANPCGLRVGRVISACLVILCASLCESRAAEIHVPADFATIQAAIVAASNGDIVVVYPGTYFENIDFLGKAITVRSTDPDDHDVVWSTTIVGDGINSCVTFANKEGTDSLLSGFSIVNGKYGVRCKGDLLVPPNLVPCPTISNNIIMNCWAAGIVISSSGAIIRYNTIRDNSGDGIRLGASDDLRYDIKETVIDSNTISRNAQGIDYKFSRGPVCITRNTFTGNTEAGIKCDYNAGIAKGFSLTIDDNEISGSRWGMWFDWRYGTITIRNNNLYFNAISGIQCSGGGIMIVDNSIVDCGLGIDSQDSSAVVIGNTISDNAYGGVKADHDTFSGNVITGNGQFGVQDGGGMRVVAVRLLDNVIGWNSARDGAGIYGGDIQALQGSIIVGNRASRCGGGIYAGMVHGNNNLIIGNSAGQLGGGVYFLQGGNYQSLEDTIVQNAAPFWPGVFMTYLAYSGEIVGSLIRDNGGPDDPQVRAESSRTSLLVQYCNVEDGENGVSVVNPLKLTWGPGNIDADPLFVDPGHWDDAGMPDDPSDDTFVLGDYHLLPGSPCIDRGTNDITLPEWMPRPTLDIDLSGIPRIIDGNLDGTATIDIGAYEFLPGDVNYDGRVNILDLITIRVSLGQDPASSPAARKADANADGRVNIEDLIFVRNLLGKNE
ncbi:MAG TPA: right-handed parallel beta-helix repeat-containing protein [Planctomycetota bacterium]|nr:right-handed parallel beta-helix repeat-containing protein [Planctomycetota bacterium]